MQNYETVFITRPELTTNQVDKMTSELEGIIKSGGGKISRKENWGLRNLAFKVRKNKKGHYMMLNFQAKSETVFEVERKIKLNEDFIRFQTFRTKDLPTKPSYIAIKTAEHAQRRAESSAVVPINHNKLDKDAADKEASKIKAHDKQQTNQASSKDSKNKSDPDIEKVEKTIDEAATTKTDASDKSSEKQ